MGEVSARELPGQVRLHPTNPELAKLAAATENLIKKQLKALGYSATVSLKSVRDIALYALRDLIRIQHQQDNRISVTKFAGYWAFWIRKIKPISNCYPDGKDNSEPAAEVLDINELVALEIGVAVLIRDGKGEKETDIFDTVRRNCKQQCDGRECVEQYARNFFSFNGDSNRNYLIYSMRHRTFGPHHLCTVFEHLIYGSCKASRRGELRDLTYISS